MKESVRRAVNNQINHEFHAAYQYLAMAAHFELESLNGFGFWMRAQAREEVEHAMRLFDFMLQRGAAVDLDEIAAPEVEFDSPLSTFRAALEHERKVTGLIHELHDLASEEHDHATRLELEWFIREQVEEEDSVGTVVEQLEMAGDDRAALLILDRTLGSRGADG
jgi:ferritin